VDPVEPDVRVDVLDPRADAERVVVLLALLVLVQRLAVSERPLPFSPPLARAGLGWCGQKFLRVAGRCAGGNAQSGRSTVNASAGRTAQRAGHPEKVDVPPADQKNRG